jgi:hypothetical protein
MQARSAPFAIHTCHGNAPAGRWLANGGYARMVGEGLPRLANFDPLLLIFLAPKADKPAVPAASTGRLVVARPSGRRS